MTRALAAIALVVMSAGCGREFSRGPMSPTAVPGATAGQTATLSWEQAVSAQIMTGAPHNHLPGPSNFTFVVNGSTVHLGWQAAPGEVIHYIIEAGSLSGQSNLAIFSSGSNATGVGVTNVPTGIYYVRVRAVLSDGQLTNVSNEIVVSVGGVCPGVVSPTTIAAPRTGATISIAVTTGCAWTAVSQSPFITVTSGASGTGNGVVSVAVAPNLGGARTGTLMIAGQLVTVTQGAANLHVGFEMFDPATQGGATTECRINANPSRCVLRSTSFTFGTSSIAHYAWTVQYTYGGELRTQTQSGIDPQFVFSEVCGLTSSDASGAFQPLSVTLTVTDSEGASATATSGAFGQPALQLRLYTCP
jgi:hypothetical protein